MRRHRARQRDASLPLIAAVLAALVAGAVAVLLPAPAIAVSLPPLQRPAAQDGLPWLSVRGDRIVDDSGRTVLLRGFNSEALLDYNGWTPAPFDDSDAALIERSGFDVVRLPVAWSRLEPQRGRWDLGYLDLVDRTVRMLNAHRIWVVLDMHFLDWGPAFGGSGAPYWASVPGVPDWGWGLPDPFNKHLSPATWMATTYFFMSSDWQSDYEQAWRLVVTRFRDRSGVAAYDLYNEPHSMPIPPHLYEQDFLFPLYARTIAGVGAADPNHIFVVEGILFADWGTEVVPMRVRNLVWSTHTYTGSLITPLFEGDPTTLDEKLRRDAGEAAQLPAPYWNGELGIDWEQAHAAQWADAALDELDDLGAGWAWWQWRQDVHWGIRDRDGTLHLDHLEHVARPYLVAAPAGATAGRGDGVAGTLRITVAAGVAAGAQVDVGWPGLTHGPPAVDGGCVATSSYDAVAGRLTLTLSGGACSVAITAPR